MSFVLVLRLDIYMLCVLVLQADVRMAITFVLVPQTDVRMKTECVLVLQRMFA